ncbi:YhcN/YlaJ family sporulation lipoprotein [Paenibacillus alkalitolerans]|uniref:YhcN/YlaJ family sporulation lipoprotein n=1 Tax=Paenibacillus alkalitolerans TaxID=2799335 RepID=UPI0018F493A7|nr:YhcN/YlaJ family sporulation lipoprotein [Paenibacillus alkalitolerans]
MFKRLMRFTVIGATVVALAACGNQQGADNVGTYGIGGNNVGTRDAGGAGMLGGRHGMHYNRNLSANRDVARAVERIDGISRANVVMSDRNAYVAVEFDQAGRGTGNRAFGGNNGGTAGNGLIGGMTTRGLTQGGGAAGGLSSSITDHGAGTNGAGINGTPNRLDLGGDMNYGRYTRMGADTNGIGNGASGRVGLHRTGMLGRNNATGMLGANNGNRMLGAGNEVNDAADGTGARYMNNGGAFGRRGGTNEAGRTFDGGVISPMTRQLIERTVRSMAPTARNVYVSADRNFMRQMDRYAAQMNGNTDAGTRGLVDGFNRFVQTIFVEPFDNDNYNLIDRYNVRNRNGVTGTLDNSFTPANPRNFGGMTDNAADTNRTPAGTINTLR